MACDSLSVGVCGIFRIRTLRGGCHSTPIYADVGIQCPILEVLLQVLSYHESNLHDEAQNMDLDDVRDYGFQLLVVLDHMWREGMLHRDLKPENGREMAIN